MINLFQSSGAVAALFSTLGLVSGLFAAANWLVSPEVDPCCGVKSKERHPLSRWKAPELEDEDRRKKARYREKSKSRWQRRKRKTIRQEPFFQPHRLLSRFK